MLRRRFIFEYTSNINNIILYTSNNYTVINPTYNDFGVTLVSNTYNVDNNIGTMVFTKPILFIGNSAFQYCYSLTSITIPNSVTSIGYVAFNNCEDLTSVTIGDSVTTIGEQAFNNCYSLKTVYCKATTPPTLGDKYVFDNNGIGRKIYVPYQSLDAYKTATYWKEYANDIVGYDFENDTVYPFPVTLEYNLYYPEVAQYLMDKYGLNYGTTENPLPIEETVMLGDSYANSTGSGIVKYISTDDTWNSSVSLKLYLENHGNTYYCVTLNTTQNQDFGLAGQYFYD